MDFKIIKYTNDDIIKAAECCASDYYPTSCHVCPLKGARCSQIMTKAVADLLKNQKEDNERLYNENNALISAQETLQKHIEKQNAEIERLQKENKILSVNADNAFQDGLNEAQDLYAEQIKNEIRAQAIEEFAERLKEYSKWYSYVTLRDIDNLVEEMVGDTDA